MQDIKGRDKSKKHKKTGKDQKPRMNHEGESAQGKCNRQLDKGKGRLLYMHSHTQGVDGIMTDR